MLFFIGYQDAMRSLLRYPDPMQSRARFSVFFTEIVPHFIDLNNSTVLSIFSLLVELYLACFLEELHPFKNDDITTSKKLLNIPIAHAVEIQPTSK